ncbi:hypothetical protein L280_13725 [Mannheimia haemolytica MhBrain2012]|nr:hypothetical protein L280_13725 [Mannheimia haemolytica MhBrain2012]EPZ27468.1 hypothetical protein L281_11370 [Mannheimia haemolytica MhSwine2000]
MILGCACARGENTPVTILQYPRNLLTFITLSSRTNKQKISEIFMLRIGKTLFKKEIFFEQKNG